MWNPKCSECFRPLPRLWSKFESSASGDGDMAYSNSKDTMVTEASSTATHNAEQQQFAARPEEEIGHVRSLPIKTGSERNDKSSSNFITPRNPKLRLLTSSSTMSDHGSFDSLASDSDSFLSELSALSEVGLMVTIEDDHCQFHLVSDANYPEIHPRVYAPSRLQEMKVLYGGGSGVAVFGGKHSRLGSIVMKHGGPKDMQELFALATINEELCRRGAAMKRPNAAKAMIDRLPSFKMIYVSPHHLMDRGEELVGLLRNFVRDWTVDENLSRSKRRDAILLRKKSGLDIGMKIRIFEGQEVESIAVDINTSVDNPTLSLVLPQDSTDEMESSRVVQVRGDSYSSLKNVVDELTPIMADRMFKFTLAQKTIGGTTAKTGNQWLYEGQLDGNILKNLVDQFTQVVKSLQSLTLAGEIDVIHDIRKEVDRFEDDDSNVHADEISKMADSFVGNAIRKNFHPQKGRQRFLRTLCAKFREGSLILTPEEEIPAMHLGNLMKSGALMSDTFKGTPMEPTLLQPHQHFWRNILRRAVENRPGMSGTALQRLWTCGLTDAGIHNLFVSETELYLFDLGEPQLMSLPGFLTKFLFSFFHTLGMEDDGNGSWVRRFVVEGDKLALSKETKDLLPKAYSAFEYCLDRLIAELLDDDNHLRWLLLEYVTMQLLSDTAFCLQKWELKGGGKERENNHNKDQQEKWLWRALWDVYVAYDINTSDSWYRFEVEHPHFRESIRTSTVEGLSDSFNNSSSTLRNIMDSLKQSDLFDQELHSFLEEDEEKHSSDR